MTCSGSRLRPASAAERRPCRATTRVARNARIEMIDRGRNDGPVSAGARRLEACRPAGYWISVSSLNIGRYIEMMITPTTQPTAIIISGSMIDVRLAIELSTSSS